MTLAIDFDGTIHDKAHPIKGRRMGKPMANAETALNLLRKKQATIIIHTVMANTESGKKCVADWMKYYKLPYDDIVGKPSADFYIDDKALQFTNNWNQLIVRFDHVGF